MRLTTEDKQRQAEAIDRLRDWCPVGTIVYTNLLHVSRSGMSRDISLYIIRDNEPVWITGYAASAMGRPLKYGGRDAIRVGGCGMDMGFALVYDLSRTLYPDGFRCIGADCPSNEHHNPPHPTRDGMMFHSSDGGYALKHRWL